MFNLNENNRIVMSQHPTDMRMGVNCLSGQVRMVGLDPSNGDVYIFVGRSRKVMKILHWGYGGYAVYYKRLEDFIASGPQSPRVGGVIMIKGESRAAVEAIIAQDPFNINGVADYQIIEFTPTMFYDDCMKKLQL